MASRRVFAIGIYPLATLAGAALLVGSQTHAAEDAAAQAEEKPISFNRDVRPILSNNCFACHGPDAAAREADLALHTRETATSELPGGRVAIVPGDPDASELMRRVTHTDPAERMPPAKTEKDLSKEQIDTLQRWIAQGADYEPHWAYIAPVRPELPPEASDPWVRNPIDGFILRHARKEGLEPAPEADKRTLIRRVSLDLTGLPPTPAEVDAFVADERPDAYRRLVDRLMASPHYGERQAIAWLDAVRYADTWGYHSDNTRSVWPYRDYIIDAFNENKPFDQFTKEQLAGDLLDTPTQQQVVATTFNFMNKQTNEGGAQDKEYLAKYMTDRVSTVGTAWLGQTMGCAECHDHKFDPITARDFYSMQAFFADIKEHGAWAGPRAGFSAEQEYPIQYVGTARQMAELERRREAVLAAQEAIPYEFGRNPDTDLFERRLRDDPRYLEGFDDWVAALAGRANDDEPAFRPVALEVVSSRLHPDASLTSDGAVAFDGPPSSVPGTVSLTGAGDLGERLTAVQLEFGEPTPAALKATAVLALDDVRVTVEHPDGTKQATTLYYHLLSSDKPSPPNLHLYGIIREEQPDYFTETRTIEYHEGLADKSLLLYLEEPLDWREGSTLGIELDTAWSHGLPGSQVGTLPPFTLAVTGTARPGSDYERALELAASGEAGWSEDEREYMRAYYRAHSPRHMQSWRSYQEKELAYLRYAETVPSTWAVNQKQDPRTIRLLPRGDWRDDSGPVVEPAVPEFLGEVDSDDGRADRLDLAKWLVANANPLTARVQMNRLWAQFLGRGLSAVLNDLGSQGEWPTHPDLLDWLAVEFEESGWDLKHMVRLIVTSATYRQSSRAPDATLAADPQNKLFARQTAMRLPAEIVRDNALAISGLLNESIGGPPVRPYQPAGYYSILNFPRRVYEPSEGEALYRRGIYMHWQRTRLHPFLKAFDAPSRGQSVVDRPNSNTPLQALALLNDPVFVEMARAFGNLILAQRVLETDDARLAWAFERATAREPTRNELDHLQEALAQARAYFDENPADAEAFLAIGEWNGDSRAGQPERAAWASVARIVLNLHETITRP